MKKQIMMGVLIVCVIVSSTADERNRTIEQISYDIFRHPNKASPRNNNYI
jgi:hypothetical protein